MIRVTETGAVDDAISTVDNEIRDLNAFVVTETGAVDDTISTVDNEISDLNDLVAPKPVRR